MKQPDRLVIDHASTHNLQNISLSIPLHQLVAIAGVSGSGKSSLAMGVLYAEGSRRYLEGLSAFTRRKIRQIERPAVRRIDFLPPALALRQRPPVPGRRSTVGTMTEIYNLLRLMFSRLGTHRCPNGHPVPPSLRAIADERCVCPVCGEIFALPLAETFSFNSSAGACPACGGLGERAEVDSSLVVPDPNKTLKQGAVASWRAAGRGYTVRLAAQLGVRLDVPFKELSDKEKSIVLHGKRVRRPLIFHNRTTGDEFPITFAYDNAVEVVRRALAGDKHQTRYARMKKFLSIRPCEVCGGSRLRPEAFGTTLGGKNIAEWAAMPLERLEQPANRLLRTLPEEMRTIAGKLIKELHRTIAPLVELGVGYLTPDRAGATLSTGERQRIELTQMAAGRTTGILYVLDEPSVGLHPVNVDGLIRIMRRMVAGGNSLVVVDHNLQIIRHADYVIEMGPGAGRGGGRVVAAGPPKAIADRVDSLTGAYLAGRRSVVARKKRPVSTEASAFLRIGDVRLHNLHHLSAAFPLNRMTAVTGVSGAGKTALVVDSLVPAVRACLAGKALPKHVARLEGASALRRLLMVDASPIGRNARSTPATYTGLYDRIRQLFAATGMAQSRGWNAARFSFNVAGGRCEACRGLGEMALDMQYLPEQRIRCPHCGGRRFNAETLEVRYQNRSIADVLAMSIDEARTFFADDPVLARGFGMLCAVGLGYLKLGEPTPNLSGGEAQRMRLAGELSRPHAGTLYVLDEPSTGLHARDIDVLIGVLDRLTAGRSTMLIIDHDPDIIANCDYVVDLGPGGGPDGGRIVAAGTPREIAASGSSVTGRYLRNHAAL